jgi:predicted RNase H-like nuclease (RuvC/YqgF family)
MRMSLPEPKSSTEQEYAAQVDQLSEALQKQEHLNKEQLETINKALQENIKLRSELDTLKSDIVKYTNIESKHESLKKQNKELQDMLKNKEETIAKLQKENATVLK